MQMASNYGTDQPSSQTMFSLDSYDVEEDHNTNSDGSSGDVMENVPKHFAICDKCQLQRPQHFPEATATVVMSSETCLTEPEREWMSQEDNISSMKLLTMLMLNAWRQRRNEVKKLQQVMENVKDENMKYRNQVHVYSTLVRVEQKRNDDLTLQLKISLESINQVRSSCDNLTSSILNLTADKEQLRRELDNRVQEYEALKLSMRQAKSDLMSSFRENRELQTRLSKGERAFEAVNDSRRDVVDRMKTLISIEDLKRKSAEEYHQELEMRDKTIQELNAKILIVTDKLRSYEDENKRAVSHAMQNMNAEIICLKMQLEEQAKVMYSFTTVNANNRTSTLSLEAIAHSFALNFANVFLYLLPALPFSTKDVHDFYKKICYKPICMDNKSNMIENGSQ